MMRLTTAFGTALVCLFIPLGEAGSQPDPGVARLPNDTVPFAPLIRPSYMWMGWPEGAWYEGDVNLPFHLWSRTETIRYPDREGPPAYDCLPLWIANAFRKAEGALLGAETLQGRRASGCTLTFVPHFVIRQLAGGSAPVRTPTFNPALEFNVFRLAAEDTAAANARRSERGGPWRKARLAAFHLRLGHYSNGQSGCLYENQEPDSCATIPGRPERLNRIDGSFSTHYVEPALTLAHLHFDSAGDERRLASATVAMRYNPAFVSDIGGMDEGLARTYGRQTISASAGLRWRARPNGIVWVRTVTNATLEGECAPERPEPYEKCRGAAALSVSFPGVYGLGFVVRYVGGWDYYNVGYGEEMRNRGHWPTLGIILDHSAPVIIRQ